MHYDLMGPVQKVMMNILGYVIIGFTIVGMGLFIMVSGICDLICEVVDAK